MTDPDAGIPDLVRRLAEDSRRLVGNEVRLARIEVADSMHRATRGVVWLTLAFGAGVVMLVAVTLLLVTLVGRAVHGHMWVGALVTGILELALGGYLVRRGISVTTTPSRSLEASRLALADTAHWVATAPRRPPTT